MAAPVRLSRASTTSREPSKFWDVIFWGVAILGVVGIWYATQSILMCGILILFRLLLVGAQMYGKRRKPQQNANAPAPEASKPIIAPPPERRSSESVKSWTTIIKDEFVDEMYGLLEFLHIYSRKERENLSLYRRMRGW